MLSPSFEPHLKALAAPVTAAPVKTPTPVVQATQAAVVSSLPVVNYTPAARREEPVDTTPLPGQVRKKKKEG